MTESVQLRFTGTLATLTLNRQETHNAFDAALIAELDTALQAVASSDARVLVLTGAGATFSAGADLHWMRGMAKASELENFDDAMALARCLRRLNTLAMPTIARVNGSAYGGGVGLLSCCDIALAVDSAKFTLSEVKLGLVPAVISPYVIDAIGKRQARRYMLSAEMISAQTAKEIGLVHECLPANALDGTLERLLHWLGKGGPFAIADAKSMIQQHSECVTDAEVTAQDRGNAERIARLRVSAEGQEGLSAFLEKRPARWIRHD